MSIFLRKKVILAKIETTYGTDASPTGAANAILAKNINITPVNAANLVSRDLLKPYLGADEQIHVGVHVLISFEVEIAGAGAAGTAPAYGPLLRACGLSETVAAGTSVTYAPVSTGFESNTLFLHNDGNKHGILGARGNVALNFDTSGIPVYQFNFVGLWQDPAAVADPTADFSAFQKSIAVTNTNTPTFSLHATTPNGLNMNFNLNNQVVYRNVIGEESVQIVNRQAGGSVTIEEPAISAKNWFTTARGNITGALQFIHGTTAGQIVQFDAPTVQVLNPTKGESDGISTLAMDLSMIPSSSGNDEVSLVIK